MSRLRAPGLRPATTDAPIGSLAEDPTPERTVARDIVRHGLILAPLLGGLLSASIPSWSVDRVIPVPLSTARLRGRGYNQAAEIARHLARGKLDVDVCVRHADAVPQTELPWDERRRNVRGAFGCRRPLTGATVAVVDDVMTTGATLDELALTLKRAGAAKVVNWVVARTLPPA